MATKKAAKKSAAKKPATKAVATKSERDTEQIVVKAITALRKNPKKYQTLRASLQAARTDEERAKRLIQYATSERQVAALLPARGQQVALATVTTVTVTTIFILEGSAY